ncbi:hypothetical protein CC1G_11334 [Coprinopsis cinerea okayama7|uniref:Uncharacterized protein n=1 Tax=Coprinopsis cinerea (strain Okayama-7 / 130 / ATCC MYA-4618 / FGSC 9003) TaxID=240176 RepID=A8P5S4_COPC7|nr:hypothetical protein CC1G_11334 [Coprinopsis cinerea okayama7\|eukprot:XP_001839011.2 hypothetical protein CC1G_11334 [Coprinopsis cinerea okayama7\
MSTRTNTSARVDLSKLSHRLSKNGQVNSPGARFFIIISVTAAYDLGATADHLQKMYEDEAKSQKSIFREEGDREIVVDDGNWVQYLGNTSAYAAFVTFFADRIQKNGVAATLEEYLFSKEANTSEKVMLVRLISGAVHPFIQLGYALEFGNEAMVAPALAQTAVHTPTGPQIYDFHWGSSGSAASDNQLSIFQLIEEVYAAPELKPGPYEPDALHSARLKGILGKEEVVKKVRELCARFALPTSSESDNVNFDAQVDSTIHDLVLAATLLTFAVSKPNRPPRLDFFLMHLVTSSLFLTPIKGALRREEDKLNLLRAFVPTLVLHVLSRGRPRIDVGVLEGYTGVPRPPVPGDKVRKLGREVIGSPEEDGDYNPWHAMHADVLYHPDTHHVKTFRTLFLANGEYGGRDPVELPAGFRITPSPGSSTKGGVSVDGTVYTRAAGVLMNYMGWVTHGQDPREDWDRRKV